MSESRDMADFVRQLGITREPVEPEVSPTAEQEPEPEDDWVQRMVEKREQAQANRQQQLDAETWAEATEAQVIAEALSSKRKWQHAITDAIHGNDEAA